MGLLSVLLLAFGTVATGDAVLRMGRPRALSPLLRFGLAVALGFAVTGLLLEGLLLVTGRVHFWPVAGLQALAVGLLLWRGLREQRNEAPAQRRDFALVAAFALIVAITAWRAPFVGYDGKAIFGYKAKVLYFERNLEGAAFQDADVVHYHADYPLALPLLMAYSAWAFEGEAADPRGTAPAASAAEWVERYDAVDAYLPLAALWIAGLLALVLGTVRERFAAGPLAWFVLVLAVPVVVLFPWAGGGSWSLAGADMPLALVLGALAVLFTRSEETPLQTRPELALTLLLTAFAIGLKQDALLGVSALVLALACTRRGLRGRWPSVAAAVVGLGAGLVVVRTITATTVGAPYDEDYLAALASADVFGLARRIPVFLESIWEALAARKMAVYWLAVLCVGVPLGWRAGGAPRFLSAWLLFFLGGCSAVFLLTPNHVGWHTATALPRLWCQLVVPAAMLVVSAAAELWSAARTTAPVQSSPM